MIVWLVTSGEPIPSVNERPHRTGILSQLLSDKGHSVVWWTTSFDHQKKTYLCDTNSEELVNANLKRVFLHSSTPYYKNISLSRIKNHYQVSQSFRNESLKRHRPDLIFCSFPTIDLAYECVRYGMENDVPVVVDVRDLWPDIFLFPFPGVLRKLVKFAIAPMVKKTKYVFRNCYSITGVSEDYLNFGLKYGERERKALDRVFPLGYDDSGLDKICLDNRDFSYLNINLNSINVWFIGTFGKSYDLLTVIRGARKIERINPNIRFIFTGDGEQMELWRNAANGLKNVVFTGWVGRDELRYIAQHAQVGLMAYAKNAPQGLPNKIFEYMAFGLPLLSCLQSEAKKLIESEEIGLSYDPQNSDDFINKLIDMTSSISRINDLKKRSKLVFDTKFNSSIIYNNLVNYIEQFNF